MSVEQPFSSPPSVPLAERLRPKQLDDVLGQEHLLGPAAPLRRLVQGGKIPSILFWGPPGVGKTTIARILAAEAGKAYFSLSAIDSGVKEIRLVIEKAGLAGGAVLFIDEIHRFNKSQQDALLGAVESGILTLIGATTENPSFEVNQALLSRAQVYVLKELDKAALSKLLETAFEKDEWLKQSGVNIKESEALLLYSGGDARKLLNVLELVVSQAMAEGLQYVSNALCEQTLQKRMAQYDKGGEMHYDIISAFIKSVRGSDPDAALYYLVRMTKAGEDPSFIARRLLILASEDIGQANPNALLMATACFDAVNRIGYPECELVLAQTTIYLAASAKSNSSYLALQAAKELADKTGDLPVPLHLRNAPTRLLKELNYGKGYLYPHDFPGNFARQQYLPDEIKNQRLWYPGSNAREQEMARFLDSLRMTKGPNDQ